MLMSKRFRISSIIWRIAVIGFLLYSFIDPTMIIFAILSGILSFIAHRRSKQAEAREAMESQEMKPRERGSLKIRKGPVGAKKGEMKTRRRKKEAHLKNNLYYK